MHRPFLALALCLGACSVLGFGCRERPLPTVVVPGQAPSAAPRAPSAPYVSKKTGDSAPAKEVTEVRQILSNLAKAESYHILISIPGTNGDIKADLFYAQKEGIHSVLHTNAGSSELYTRDERIFVKYATSSWQDISATDEGQAARTQFRRGLFINDDGTSAFLIRDSAKVASVKDDPAGCKLYTFEQSFFRTEETDKQSLEICVKNSYPVRIKSVSNMGAITMSYDRFDDDTIPQQMPKL